MALSKLSLSVGMVHIPVRIDNAIGTGTKPSGKYVCAASGVPMKSSGGGGGGSVWCGEEHDGVECSRAIGYPKPDGTFFVPADDDLQRLVGEKDRLIKLDTFVPTEEIDSVYFEKTYVPKPEKGHESAFWLVAGRLQALDRIACGRATISEDEKMIFLRWSSRFECLFVSVGVYDEQIKKELIAASQATRPDVTYGKPMIEMADTMMKKVFISPFEPEDHQPTRWHGLRDLILANGASPNGEAKGDTSEPTVDLMASLKATVAAASAKKPAAPKKPATRKTTSRKKVA